MPKKTGRNRPAAERRREVELAMLRLAAMAIDLRGMLSPHEISDSPVLEKALSALDDLFQECYADGPTSALNGKGSAEAAKH